MPELSELYRELIIDHGRHPRNFGSYQAANRIAEGFNPLCGDRLKIYLTLNPMTDTVDIIRFEGTGCAISIASASLMTEALQGKTKSALEDMIQLFHTQLTKDTIQDEKDMAKLAKLSVLSGVRAFPSRVKCATLAWHTLKNALYQNDLVTSTE